MKYKHEQNCPIAAATNIIGDRWTLLILREAFRGITRFKDLHARTSITKARLSERLNRLIDEGLIEKIDIAEKGTRFEYRLTEKGWSLSTVLIAVYQWGNTHIFGEGSEPVLLVEKETGLLLPPLQIRSQTGDLLSLSDITMVAGPGSFERKNNIKQTSSITKTSDRVR